jgi:hypothetical protein
MGAPECPGSRLPSTRYHHDIQAGESVLLHLASNLVVHRVAQPRCAAFVGSRHDQPAIFARRLPSAYP